MSSQYTTWLFLNVYTGIKRLWWLSNLHYMAFLMYILDVKGLWSKNLNPVWNSYWFAMSVSVLELLIEGMPPLLYFTSVVTVCVGEGTLKVGQFHASYPSLLNKNLSITSFRLLLSCKYVPLVQFPWIISIWVRTKYLEECNKECPSELRGEPEIILWSGWCLSFHTGYCFKTNTWVKI